MSLRAGSGGVVLRIMVGYGTSWLIMVVAYILAVVTAVVGSTSAALVKKRMYQT